jgi:Ser/Thr protein kinase RdoA (MazF antagonist)
VLVADRVLYFRTPDRLGELVPIYGAVLAEAVARVQPTLDALWRDPPHPPHLLHGDIQTGNIIVTRGAVELIDFQDLIWGFEIQDALIALRGFEHSENVPALKAAFRAGYETLRAWPGADAETTAALQAARHLNILNFGLSVRGPGFDEFVARHAGPIVDWMGTG